MNWVKKWKLLAIKVIQYNGQPYIKLNNLWQALHMSFNIAQNHQINMDLLEKIASKPVKKWSPFSKEKFTSVIAKYNSSSTSGPDKLLWRHLKRYVKDIVYLRKLIAITNICIELGYWLLYFKVSIFIIIPKPNKESYDSP